MNIINFTKRKSIAILLSFLITFIASRIVVFFIQNKIGSPFLQYNIIGNVHVHHFTYGILILCIIGFVALFVPDRWHKTWLYIMFGIGMGLVFDEFGILLQLDAKYDAELSYLAVFIVSMLLMVSALVEHEYRKLHLHSKITTTKKKRKRK